MDVPDPLFLFSLVGRSLRIVCLLSIMQSQGRCWEPPVYFFSQGSTLKCPKFCAFSWFCRIEPADDISVLSSEIVHPLCWVTSHHPGRFVQTVWEHVHTQCRGSHVLSQRHTQSAGGIFQPVIGGCRWRVPWGSWEGLLVEWVSQLGFSDSWCGYCKTSSLSLLLVPLIRFSLTSLLSDLDGAKQKWLLRWCLWVCWSPVL